MESRGNRQLMNNGVNIGSEQIASTLHFGPYYGLNAWETSSFKKNFDGTTLIDTFHRYQMEWTPDRIQFSVDDVQTGVVDIGSAGFWSRGNFESRAPGTWNPWQSGTKSAPFDQEFYFILNLAVGGIAFFPDQAVRYLIFF